MATLLPFDSWSDVLEAAASGEQLYYLAPLDRHPSAVAVVKIFKNGKLRIDPLSNQADRFTADSGHLARFKRRESDPPPEAFLRDHLCLVSVR